MIPLRLTEANCHDLTLSFPEEGVTEVRTTGSDPYAFTEPLPAPPDPRRDHVLAFEYFSATGTDATQVFLVPPLREIASEKGAGLIRSEGWTTFSLDLKPLLEKHGAGLRALRLDFGDNPGKVIRLRNLQLRPPTEQELRLARDREARQAAERRRDAALRAYLTREDYPCRVTKVAVDDRRVAVEGRVSAAERARGGLLLAEVPIHIDLADPGDLPWTLPLTVEGCGRFSASVARREGGALDRLLSRWMVVRRRSGGGGGYEPLSHARYADSVTARAGGLRAMKPRNKKGIGALGPGRPLSDLDDLGISAATVNVVLNGLLFTTPGPDRTPYAYGGRTWHVSNRQVAEWDRTFLEAAKRGIVVSAILLISQARNTPDKEVGRLLSHPDADPAGIFVMPDLTTAEGVAAYAAALNFLAERYSRPDGRFGRIHHWILHNEVNAGWVWTNAGEKSALRYTDLYHRSMRLAHLIARQYDPNAKTFASLEHHWTMVLPRHYAGREVLEWLARLSTAEGDFDWGIAYHPYPQNLFEPRVWEDHEPTFSFDTPKITFKNLEVLDAFVRLPRMRFRGRSIRPVHLSEQGLNSRDYSETALRDQAAGMAYAWHKYRALDSVEVFHYHNWVDNRGEGGLRIGLRRFPDDRDDPHGRKPVWFVYQALGTPGEARALAPYLPVVGVRDWSEVRYRGPIR